MTMVFRTKPTQVMKVEKSKTPSVGSCCLLYSPSSSSLKFDYFCSTFATEHIFCVLALLCYRNPVKKYSTFANEEYFSIHYFLYSVKQSTFVVVLLSLHFQLSISVLCILYCATRVNYGKSYSLGTQSTNSRYSE